MSRWEEDHGTVEGLAHSGEGGDTVPSGGCLLWRGGQLHETWQWLPYIQKWQQVYW